MIPKNRKELIEVMARISFDPNFATKEEADHEWEYLPSQERVWWIEREEKRLTALEQSGCEVVPREATEGMVEVGRAALSSGDHKLQTHARVIWVWDDMLSACPFKD